MSVIKNTLTLCVCLLLFGCGKQTVKPSTVQKPPMPTAVLKNTTILPLWLEDHRLVNYISAIGSSAVQKIGGEQAQYNVAMAEARINLSNEYKKYLQALNVRNKIATTRQSNDDIKQRVEMLLFENAIVQEEWQHPETGRIYLWLIIPKH